MNMTKTCLLAIAMLFSQAIIAQSNGCGGSPPNLPVNASCINQGFTNNQNGTGQTVNASCSGGYGTAYQDVWYTVTGTGNPITITLSGANRDAVLAAFTACGAGELACTTIDAGNTGSIVFASTPATTYYIQIQRRSGNNNNNQNGNICATSVIAGPPNDDPCSATPLAVNASCVNTLGDNSTATASAGVPAPGCANYQGGDVWYTVTVPASGNVTVETSIEPGGFTDGGLAIYSGTCASLSLISCDDDSGTGAMEIIALTGQTPGATLWVRVWEFGNNNNGAFNICAREDIPPTNVTCSQPDPICSGTPILFTAQANGTDADVVNPGNNYGCLSTSPNPSWYYLEISGAGDLAIDITAGSDVDFAIWGPYADLATAISRCDSHGVPLDCSYSTSPTEQANVNGVLVGEVYILLVTNYASVVQTITVSDAPSNTAQTNCAILPVELADFSGEMNEGTVSLQWTTLSEVNNDYFAVERSSDGVNWSVFDVVDGNGNSTETIHYSTRDLNPHTGVNYYRLRQFDFNGKISVSDIIGVMAGSNQDLELFPNPAENTVLLSSKHDISQVIVRDIQGTVIEQKENVSGTQNALDLSGMKGGVYLITIQTSNGIFTQRLVKK